MKLRTNDGRGHDSTWRRVVRGRSAGRALIALGALFLLVACSNPVSTPSDADDPPAVITGEPWVKAYGTTNSDDPGKTSVGDDGSIWTAATAYWASAGSGDAGWLLHFNQDGTVADYLTLFPESYYGMEAKAIAHAGNGDTIFLGWERSLFEQNVIRVSPEGEVIWSHEISLGRTNLFIDTMEDVEVHPDGTIFVVGDARDSFTSVQFPWIVQLSSDGDKVWESMYDEYNPPTSSDPDDTESIRDAALSDDGRHLYLATDTGQIISIDTLHKTIRWAREYELYSGFSTGSQAGLNAIAAGPGGTVVAVGALTDDTDSDTEGWAVVVDEYGDVVWVMKLDADTGNRLWDFAYGGSGDELSSDVDILPDGDILITAGTDSYGSGGTDLWMLRLPADGDLGSVLFKQSHPMGGFDLPDPAGTTQADVSYQALVINSGIRPYEMYEMTPEPLIYGVTTQFE